MLKSRELKNNKRLCYKNQLQGFIFWIVKKAFYLCWLKKLGGTLLEAAAETKPGVVLDSLEHKPGGTVEQRSRSSVKAGEKNMEDSLVASVTVLRAATTGKLDASEENILQVWAAVTLSIEVGVRLYKGAVWVL